MDLQTRIANLPPEKRDALLRKLQKPSAAETRKTEVRIARLGDGQNFALAPDVPKVINTMSYHAAERIEPKGREVEIEISASALNFRDLMIVLGMYPEPPGMKSKLGADSAGRVVRVGDLVESLKPGDEVFAMAESNFGAYTTVHEDVVMRKPANLTMVEACVIPTVYLTAYHGMEKLAQVAAGERILIHSASGGVGLAAIEIARWKGAEIYATAGTPEKRAFLHGLGIEHVFDSRSLQWFDDVLRVTNGEGVDVVLNSRPGPAIVKGMEVLRRLGRFLEIGKKDIYDDMQIGLKPFSKAISFHAIDLGYLPGYRRVYLNGLMREVAEHFTLGHFQPFHIHHFKAAQAVDAFNLLQSGAHIGKVVIDIAGQDIPVKFTEAA